MAGRLHRTTVLLPTGDRVGYDAASPRDLRVRTRVSRGAGAGWRAFTVKGHSYVVPLSASPFLGTVLDPSLFDVTALAAGRGRQAVTVGVAVGSAAHVPGLTVTKRAKGQQRGYFTAAGARTFGAAVLQAALQSRGRTSATRSLFGAASISAGSAGHRLSPKFPQQTVIFKVTGPDGQPLPDGLLFYGNLDDAARASGFAVVVDGEVRVSLPAGSYTLFGDEVDFPTDTTAVEHLVTQPQLAVTGAANQVVSVDFRTATSTLSFQGPVPTTLRSYSYIYDRTWDSGGFTGFGGGDASLTVKVAPAPAPAIGSVAFDTVWQTVPSNGAAEEYDAAFQQQGAIDADQAYTADADEFADLQERFYPISATASAFFAHGVMFDDGDGSGAGVGMYSPISAPQTRLDHLLAPEQSGWQDDLLLGTADNPFAGEVSDVTRTYAAGSQSQASWLQQAVAPALPRFGVDSDSCFGCRTRKQLAVAVIPVQDPSPSGHFGFVSDPKSGQLAARLRLYRNGKLIKDAKHAFQLAAAVPTGTSMYKVVADSTPSVLGFTYGGIAQTQWQFKSSSSSGASLGYDAACLADGKGACRVLPMLQITAPLPVALDGTLTAGSHSFPLCASPVQGAAVQVKDVAGQVSYDDGRTFQQIPVTPGPDGCSTATITVPNGHAGTTGLVRFTATGDSGSSVVTSVHDAFRVAN